MKTMQALKKRLPAPVRALVFAVLCLPFGLSWSADPAAVVANPTATVTADTLKLRLKEIDASTTLDEATRASLTEGINKALANLDAAGNNKATTDIYIQLRATAPAQLTAIRAQLELEQQAPDKIELSVNSDSSFEEIERELLQEKANLAAVETKRTDLEAQLESVKERPTTIPEQLADAKQAREDLEAEQKLPAPANELSLVTDVRRWVQSTRIAALRSEISMLDQELLTMPFRTDLLEAQRDQLARTAARITARVKLLEDLASRQGRMEAKAAEIAAEAAVYDAAGKHPLIQQLAARNAELTRDISALAIVLKKSGDSDESIDRDAKRINDDYRVAREQLEVAGINEAMGEVLMRQRQSLPDLGNLRRKLKKIEADHARVTLQLIQYDAELTRLRDPETSIADFTRELRRGEDEQLRDDLLKLMQSRRDLLEKSIKLNKSYSRSLTELAASYRQLLDSSTAYDAFLAQNLLWIRSAAPPGIHEIITLPAQFSRLFSPSRWIEVLGAAMLGVRDSLPAKLLLLLFAGLILKTRNMRRKLVAMGEPVGKPAVDKFLYTFKALGLTLLLAVPWPLLVMTLGWVLAAGPEVTPFPEHVSGALLQVAPTFFYIQFFSVLCLPGGVADKHFRWSAGVTKSLYREFRLLKITLLPLIFTIILAADEDMTAAMDGIERLSMVLALLVVALFFYRLSRLLMRQSVSSMVRQRYFWLTLTIAAPLLLAVLAIIGFFYTAGMLGAGLIQTLWIAFGLVVLHQVVVRWLLLAQRRLALQAARERLTAVHEERGPVDAETEGVPVQVEAPEIDLLALSEDTRKLLSLMLVIVGFFGFWYVWSDIMPAFNVLNEVTLWHKPSIVDGEETMVPVSLANLFIALLIAFLTYAAMKRLPPLLEIVLLHRINMTSGSRYTARTLTTYAIVGIGLIAFFNVVGMDWSRVQWLFAALSVGIGFGLQEIVANFISGLIILFERPIRVGDVVTIGETEGVVSRIQIRATTIRTWDAQELLVPNKEFITGRLLNWSLSDQTTRIKIPVGIAYGSDVQKAMLLMDEAARQNQTVLSDPGPYIVFNGFGDNALNLELRCYVGTQPHRVPAITNLHEEINRRFNAAGISIAFPQRDIHLDVSAPIDVRIHRDDGQGSHA
jgi:potassium efflux system protein